MAHDRRFRFGIQLHVPAGGTSWPESARKAEDLGYSTLHLPDHFGNQLAPIPAMMSAADATTRLRVGTLVFDNDYRHPLLLAQEIATLDQLSGGRVEFGLGSGWMRTDYDASGISYDAPKVRVERFMEGVEVIKGLWGPGPFSFSGEHYTITNHDCLPKPAQAGGPPLLIGAGGPRMLRFAGQHADIVGITAVIKSGAIDADAARDGAADRYDLKVQWVKEGAGDRFDDIELSSLVFVAVVTDDAASIAEMMAPGFGVEPDEVLQSPMAAVGTIDEICDQLVERRERWGISYVVFQDDAFETMAPVVARLAGT